MFFELYFDRYSEEGAGKQGKTGLDSKPGWLLSAVWHVVATWGGMYTWSANLQAVHVKN